MRIDPTKLTNRLVRHFFANHYRFVGLFFLQFLLMTFGAGLTAQTQLSDTVIAHFASLKADMIRPLDSDFRDFKVAKSSFLQPCFALHSKREKLEMRYYLQREDELGNLAGMPHVATARFLMDIGSNDEDSQTAVHSFGKEEMAIYAADWAKLFTFQPKSSFAPYAFAQLVALYKEDRGLIWVVLLFNTPPDTLDTRQLAARFLE